MVMKKGLSYDDVLIVPSKSEVRSRKNVDTSSKLCKDIVLDSPVISANMDTVTGKEMLKEMSNSGGMGIHHRYLPIEKQAENIRNVECLCGGSVGIDEDYVKNSLLLQEAGSDVVCVDIAHGHMVACIDAVEELSEELDVPIIAGNVATAQGAKDLYNAGADIIKVGIGPGSTCTTREKAGVGVPQFTAVRDVRKILDEITDNSDEFGVIADGGIKKPGDVSKAIFAGADAVMCGGIFGGCEETPGQVVEVDDKKYKEIRGMASSEARENRKDIKVKEQRAIEGKKCYREVSGNVEDQMKSLIKGLKSSMSYIGSHNISETRENVEFIQVTNSTINRNGVHNHDIID
jgi:IMP dehydrogenase